MIIVFFQLLYLFEKYIYEKFFVTQNESEDFTVELLNKTSSCESYLNSLAADQTLDQFYDDSNNVRTMKFSPPAYLQRYNAVCNILLSPQYRGKIRKVVDFGCSEFGLFKHLKNISEIHEVLCVDIDEQTLRMNLKNIEPLSADYLHIKNHPFNVYVYAGSVTHNDKNLENSDAVICIELIEHLYAETLLNVPKNIFEFIKPRLAIFTTPNADFNVLFPNLKGFRHYDHKFEWTRSQFENWATDIINKYPDYQVRFEGICPGPTGTEKFGCCTQMAIFDRREDVGFETVSGVDGLFKLITKIDYPFRLDNRPKEMKILDDAAYFIRRYQFNSDCDDETMPLDYLTRVMDYFDTTNEEFCTILSDGGYHIVHDKSRGPIIMLQPLSTVSSITSDRDVTFDNWSHSSHPKEYENDENWKESADIDALINDIEHDTDSQNGRDKESSYFYGKSIPNERDISNDYESIHSIFMESSKNENSLLYPRNISDPNFQFSIASSDSSVLMRHHDIASEKSFTNDDDSKLQVTSTPNNKPSFSLKNYHRYGFNDKKEFKHKTNPTINTDMVGDSLPGVIQAPMILSKDTPSINQSPEFISDSGYPNTCSAPDATPEHDLPSIAPDSESDSEHEIHMEQPHNNFHDDEVENGDLANNNRDNEGNNVIAQIENDDLENLEPYIEVFENDLENENDIYDLQNGFPIWLLRIYGARFL